MENYITSSVYKTDYSIEKKEEIFDTVIDELYQEPGTFIRTSDDFWNFFNNTSSAIPIFEPDDRSHQYLVDNARNASQGEIIVFRFGEQSASFNDIGQIVQDSASLAAQVKTLNAIIESTTNEGITVSIPNGNFEAWTTGSLDKWIELNSSTIPECYPTPVAGVSGSTAVRLTWQPYLGKIKRGELWSEKLWLTANSVYKLSGWYRKGSPNDGWIWIGDSRGYYEYGNTHRWKKDISLPPTNDWEEFEYYFTPVANGRLIDPENQDNKERYRGCECEIRLMTSRNLPINPVPGDWTEYDNLKLEVVEDWPAGAETTITGSNTLIAPSYIITYNAINGIIQGDTTQNVSIGEDGTAVTAIPNTGYTFVGWSDLINEPSRYEADVQADITLTANFTIDGMLAQLISPTNGTVFSIESNPILEWESIYTEFDIKVSWAENFYSNPQTLLNYVGLSIPIMDIVGDNYLDYGMRVYWKVGTHLPDGSISWTEPSYFDIEEQPERPE